MINWMKLLFNSSIDENFSSLVNLFGILNSIE